MVNCQEEDFMGKSQPTYTKEFKQQAVQLFETSKKSKTQIARDLGISDSALSKWCKEFGERGEEAFPGKGHQTAIEEEMRLLKHENEILRQERDILKKAVSIFAQPQP
jgi:transposase